MEAECRRGGAMIGQGMNVVLDFVDDAVAAEGASVAGLMRARVEVADDQRAAGCGDACEFGIDGRTSGKVADHQPVPCHVEGGVDKR